MKIALLGYMGSGKSAVGKALAEALNIPFFDLDTLIETALGESIPATFERKGELYFRNKESSILSEFTAAHMAYVLATGGGTPCYGDNLKLLEDAGVITIYLKVGIQKLASRLREEKTDRPLISHLSDTDLIEFIGKHIFERSPYYTRAQIQVPVEEMSIDDVVRGIQDRLGEINGGIS